MRRVKSESHLDFIRSLPCLLCHDNTSVEAAHLRFADLRAAKRQTGMGEKPDDAWALPLCRREHDAQHAMNERAFWHEQGIDPVFVALALWHVSGDHEAGTQIVLFARNQM